MPIHPSVTRLALLVGIVGALAPHFVRASASETPVERRASQQPDAKAAAVLEQARTALGGSAKIAAVKSLTAEGSYRRVMPDREMSGDLELALALPDRFQRIERFARPDGMPGPAIAQTIDGDGGWAGPVGGTGGGMVMMRFGDQGGREPDPAAIARRLRPDFIHLLLGSLLESGPTSALTFTHAGEAQSPDGTADVLDVAGPDDFRAKLFIAQDTHLPLMVTFQAPDMRRSMRVMTAGGPGGPGAPGGGGGRGGNLSPEERKQRMEEMRKRMEAEGPPPPPPVVEQTLFFGEHRKVDGVMLPHRFTRAIAGETFEEWEIEKYKVNAAIKADQFKKP